MGADARNLEGTRASLEADLAQARARIAELEEARERLARDNQSAAGASEHLIEELDTAQQMLAKLREEIAQLEVC